MIFRVLIITLFITVINIYNVFSDDKKTMNQDLSHTTVTNEGVETKSDTDGKTADRIKTEDAELYYIITIKDITTNEALGNAKINISDRPQAYFTDSNGTFRFKARPGKYRIVVTHPRYVRFSGTLEIVKEKETKTTLRVRKSSKGLDVILVTASRIKQEISKSKITKGEIKTIPGARNDPVRALVTSVSGVALSSSLGSGDFVVRGGEPDDNVIYFDNMLAYSAFHFGGFISIFHSEAVESIDFYTSAFPPGYGPYFGSVMDIKTTKYAKKEISAYVDISILLTSFFIEGPIGDDWYFMFGARRSYLELIASVLPDFDTVPYFWDYFFKMSYRPNEEHQIDFIAFAAQDGAKIEIEIEEDEENEIDPQAAGEAKFESIFFSQGFNWYYTPSKDFSSTMTLGLYLNRLDLKFGTLEATGEPFKLKVDPYTFNFKEDLSYMLDRKTNLYGGLFLFYIYSPYDISAPRITQEGQSIGSISDLGEVYTEKGTQTSLSTDTYAGIKRDFDPFKVNVGFDYHYFKITGKHFLSPKVIGQYNPEEEVTLSAGVGLYPQPPTVQELIEPWGTSDLSYQKSWHYILGFKYNPNKLWEYKIEGFFKTYHNLVVNNPDYYITGEGKPLANLGTGKSYGFEANIKRSFGDGYYGWLNYTLSFAKRRDFEAAEERYSEYDQRHILNFLFSWDFAEHWRIGAKWRLNSGQPYDKVVGRIPVLDENGNQALDSNGNPIFRPIYIEEKYSARLPVRHQLDVRLSFLFSILSKKDAVVYFELLNAYGRDNVIGYEYYNDYSNYNSPEETTDLPLIPSFGFEWRF